MQFKKSRSFIILRITGGLVAILAATFYIMTKPTKQELFAEQIIHSYMDAKGIDSQPKTGEFKLFMRSILFGEQSDLTEIGAGFVNSQEELDYVLSYAWEFSGYKELYGKYNESDIEEVKSPTSTMFPTPEPTSWPGLNDGWSSFTNANFVRRVAFDKDGFLWTAGSGGVVRWNLADGTYVKYTADQGLPNSLIRGITATDDGILVIGANIEIAQFDGIAWNSVPLPSNIEHLFWATASNGKIIASNGFGLFSYNGKTWDQLYNGRFFGVFGAADYLLNDKDNTVWLLYFFMEAPNPVHRLSDSDWDELENLKGAIAITISDDGVVWCLKSSEVVSFNGTEWTSYPLPQNMDLGLLSSIAISAEKDIWVGSWDKGVFHFNGANWENITTDDGLPSNSVSELILSPDGFVVVAHGIRKGISYLSDAEWINYVTDDEFPSNELALAAFSNSGALCVGWRYNIACMDGNKWEHFSTPISMPNSLISFSSDDGFWIGSGRDVYYLDGSEWEGFNIPGWIRTLEVAPDGSLWAGTNKGICRISKVKEELICYTTVDGLVHDTVQSISADPNGNLWIGTAGGVSFFTGQTWSSYTTNNGLVSNNVLSTAIDSDDSLWFGTADGISHYDGTNWVSFSEVKSAKLMTFSADGKLWVSTGRDVVANFDGVSWEYLSVEGRLAHGYIKSMLAAPDNAIWLIGESGVARYAP